MPILPRYHALAALTFVVSISSLVRAEDLPRLPEDVFPSLQPYLQHAVAESPRMLLQRLNLEIAQGDKLQNRAGLLPSVGGYYSKSQTQDERQDLPGQRLDTSKTYYNISVTQPVFYWGARVNAYKMSVIREKISHDQYEDAYRQLLVEIRNAYLGLVSLKCQIAAARFNESLAHEALRSGEERVAKKTLAEGEIFRLRIASEQSEIGLASLEAQFVDAKQNFAALTGTPAPEDDQIPDSVPELIYYKPTYDGVLSSFLAQKDPATPSLVALRRQITVNDLDYRNARKRLLPTASISAGISQDEQSYTVNIAQKYGVRSKFVSLNVNWAIFDGLATRGAVASALARKRQAQASYTQAIDAAQRQAQSAVRGVDIAYRQMALNDRLLDNSMQYLKYRREDFKRGQSSESDVNAAQAGYNAALVGAVNARIGFLLKGLDLVSATATDPALAAVKNN